MISDTDINERAAESVEQDQTARMCRSDLALHTPQYKFMISDGWVKVRMRWQYCTLERMCEIDLNVGYFNYPHKT